MLGATVAELREEGVLPQHDRRRAAAGDGADLGQGGGAAVQAVPDHRGARRRQPARPGDALDRRGHGHRHRLRPGLRQGPARARSAGCRRAGRCSSRSRTATSGRCSSRSSGSSTSASGSCRPPARRRCSAATGSTPTSCVKHAERGEGGTSVVDLINAGRDRDGRQLPERRQPDDARRRLRDPRRDDRDGQADHHDRAAARGRRPRDRGRPARRPRGDAACRSHTAALDLFGIGAQA